MSDVVEWRGERWYWYKDYYRNRRGKLLHRELYIDEHGPLPDGYHVHHRDENKKNWALDNLVALPISEHIALHPRGFATWSLAQRSIASIADRETKKPRRLRCIECDTEFESTGQRAKVCRPACKQRNFYKRHPGYQRQAIEAARRSL